MITPADSTDLDDKLAELQSNASGHFAAYRRTHSQLHSLLAESYLWWREAAEQLGYLDSLYQRHEIGQKTTDNKPNFNPLIRLIWQIREPTENDRATISQWNKALQGIDVQFCEHPEEFNHNPVGKLVSLIERKGGVVGFQEGRPTEREPQDGPASPGPEGVDYTSELAIAALQSSPGIGLAVLDEPIRVGQDDLVLLLAKRKPDGKVIILDSSNESGDIKKASLNAIRRNFTGLPPRLRTIVEIVITQTFPSIALPSSPQQREEWFQKRFSEETDLWDLCSGCEPKGEKSRTSKRLLIRSDGNELLLSSNMTLTSPVTRCIPNEWLFGTADTYLGFSELALIERWIESGELAHFRFGGTEEVAIQSDGAKAACVLTVRHQASGSSRVLQFHEHAPDLDISHTQGQFERVKFQRDWQVGVTSAWFRKMREVWTDRWFLGLGRFNQILRPHNATLGLTVGAEAIEIVFNQQEGAVAPRERFLFPEPIAAHSHRYSFLSKDLAPVLANISDIPATGGVVLSGNRHAIVFEYSTPVGLFEIAVPTLRPNSRERDGTLFGPADGVFPVVVHQ